MKPRDYLVILTIRSDAPIAVLRDRNAYNRIVGDLESDTLATMEILTVQVKELEP